MSLRVCLHKREFVDASLIQAYLFELGLEVLLLSCGFVVEAVMGKRKWLQTRDETGTDVSNLTFDEAYCIAAKEWGHPH